MRLFLATRRKNNNNTYIIPPANHEGNLPCPSKAAGRLPAMRRGPGAAPSPAVPPGTGWGRALLLAPAPAAPEPQALPAGTGVTAGWLQPGWGLGARPLPPLGSPQTKMLFVMGCGSAFISGCPAQINTQGSAGKGFI